VLGHCWLGYRKGIWPVKYSVKNSDSKPLGMLVNASGWNTARTSMWVCEDAQDKDDWRLKNGVSVCMYHREVNEQMLYYTSAHTGY